VGTETLETNTGADIASHDSFFDQLRVAITGGTSGLGLALVREFSARGARVAFLARHAEAVAKVERENQNTHGIVADVANKDEIYPAALQIVGELGGLEILINNASDLGPVPLALLADTSCEDLEKAMTTNVLGPFRLTKALLGALSASAREGRAALVINISSDAAVTPYPKWGAYGASKAALRHMTEIWNQELSVEGVRFVSFDPGDMDTPMHALAVPDADRTTLKTAEAAAHELITAIETTVTRPA
jgi:NAD(P)-dependent dehydrogenase (short-subunit alcohol dehydrogenase family)